MAKKRDSTCVDLWVPTAFEYFARPASRDFDPEAPWQHSYYVLNIDESDFSAKKPSPQGVLHITRERTKSGRFELCVDLIAAKQQWKTFFQTKIKIKCRADQLGTPYEWQVETAILDTDGNTFKTTRVAESGRVKGGWIIRKGKKTRRIKAPEEFTSNFSLFEAVQRLGGRKIDSGKFDLLEDMDLLKPDQKLYNLKETGVETNDGKMKLRGYCLIGRGILPYHYWLDENNRLVLASGSLRAFVFNPDASLENCDTSWVFHEVKAK